VEHIKLSDIIHACLDFKLNPSEEAEEEINRYINQLEVKTYLPLTNKEFATICILGCIPEKADAGEAALNIEAGKVFYGILQYVVNLDIDISYGLIAPAMIDALYEFGVIDYILDFCEKDIERLWKMLDEILTFANIQKIVEIPNLMSDEKLEEVAKAIKDFRTELTPEMLERLKTISTNVSDEFQTLKETVATTVHDAVMDKAYNELQGKPEDAVLEEEAEEEVKEEKTEEIIN